MNPQPEKISSVGLIVCPLSADYRVNNTVNPLTVKMLFELALLVNGVLLAPLTMLLELHLALHRTFILAGIVILAATDATFKGY